MNRAKRILSSLLRPAARAADPNAARLDGMVKSEAMLWGDAEGPGYHARAEAAMDAHWNGFLKGFLAESPIDYARTVDFACGYGRNTAKLLEAGAGRVTMVDVNPENLARCAARFAGDARVDRVQCNGYGLAGLADRAYTFVYSFDAMVHFDVEIVAAYMPEFFRVLAPGGYAFLHTSMFDGAPGKPFTENPHWRNFMSPALFEHLAIKAGFEVARLRVVEFDGIRDGYSTLRKPA